jgi:sulfoacetaldehyde dehydrogenase
MNDKKKIEGIINQSRIAQQAIENYSQKQVDLLVAAIGWAGIQEDVMKKLAEQGQKETRLGTFEGKYNKMSFKIRGIMRDMKGARTVGVIDVDEERGLTKIAKPIGVIAALVPCTNPCVTPFLKAMWAIKSRNSVIFSPHPRSKETNTMVCEIIRDVLERHGAPKDLVLYIEEPSIALSNELMAQCDTVVATGGSAMVKAAYSSGTPSYGVGVGNAVVIVDETADLKQYADDLAKSQLNDNSTGCSTENAIILEDSIYQEMLELLSERGGYIVEGENKTKLTGTMWKDGVLNRNIVGQSAAKIADMAGIQVEGDASFLLVPETDTTSRCKYATEKLSPVLTVYRYKNFEQAIDMLNSIQSHCGAGHSCGIQSQIEDRIMAVAFQSRTSRVMVGQATGLANAGSWSNGMPVTATLGCGSWGGNSISENVNHRFFYNVTWVSRKITEKIIPDEELFSDVLDSVHS